LATEKEFWAGGGSANAEKAAENIGEDERDRDAGFQWRQMKRVA
jgi:hypothetical protein